MFRANNNKGFSLVELMVVVAIIGILASVAIPSMQKFMAKARQSEAKTNLSGIYTAEKAFYAEYSTYDPRFGAIGFSPEGKLRYNVGFASGAAGALAVAPVYTATLAGSQLSTSTKAYCAIETAVCTALVGADGAAQPDATTGTISTNAFSAGAAAVIQNGAATDTWTIDQARTLTNSVVGIK